MRAYYAYYLKFYCVTGIGLAYAVKWILQHLLILNRQLFIMIKLGSNQETLIERKFGEFIRYSQQLKPGDTYFIVNRNASILSRIVLNATKDFGLNVTEFNISSDTPYREHFPDSLLDALKNKTPKGGMGLFDYSKHVDFELSERPARIDLLYNTIQKVPISWAHAPGIDVDMALNGALQCDYKSMAEKSEKMLKLLKGVKKLHVRSPSGTNLEIVIPENVRFATDCIIKPPGVYGDIGRFGNIPVGEVCGHRRISVSIHDRKEGIDFTDEYPVKLIADGVLVGDVCVGGFSGLLKPNQKLYVEFRKGLVTDYRCDGQILYNSIFNPWKESQKRYELPIVMEEVGIGFNDKARPTGNMLESEKMGNTMHIAPGGIGVHEDILFSIPTVDATYIDGRKERIMTDGRITW